MGGIIKQESLALCALLLDGSRDGEASVTAILAVRKSVSSSIFSQYIDYYGDYLNGRKRK